MLETTIIHHDNAQSHRAALTQETIKRLRFDFLDHLPYSPDLAACNFSYFRGTRFEDVTDLPLVVQQAIRALGLGLLSIFDNTLWKVI